MYCSFFHSLNLNIFDLFTEVSYLTARQPFQGQILTTLPKFGPKFEIKLSFTLWTLHENDWGSILRISNGEPQSRYPAIQINRGKLWFFNDVNNDRNYHQTYTVELGKQYNILIKQNGRPNSRDTAFYEVYVNGNEVINVENRNVMMLENAYVYFAEPQLPVARVLNASLKIDYIVDDFDDLSYQLEGRIVKIETKTGWNRNAASNDVLKIYICGEDQKCCLTNNLRKQLGKLEETRVRSRNLQISKF